MNIKQFRGTFLLYIFIFIYMYVGQSVYHTMVKPKEKKDNILYHSSFGFSCLINTSTSITNCGKREVHQNFNRYLLDF